MTLAINVGDDAPEWVSGWVARSGIPLSLQGTPLIFEVDPQLPHRRGPYLPAARAEDFRVSVEGDSGSPSRITVFGRTPRALRRAAVFVARAVHGEPWPVAGATHGPAFSVRGLLEGFYGPPWPHEARLRMIEDCGDLGLTHMFVAPKDEVGQRQHWASLLDVDSERRVRELVASAQREQVRLMCAVSPGLSIVWSSEDDLSALVERFRQLHSCGVRDAALFLDDIPAELTHPADLAAYPDVPTAHADLAARWARALWADDPTWRLAVCPQEYHGRGDEVSLSAYAALLPAPVDVMWTGREICSRTLDLLDGASFWRNAGRPPLWWDNYPVNDLAMRDRLHIGPLLGRDPHLYRVSAGVFSNAMDLPECTRIPLGTIADYLWDPESYDPDESWQRSLRRVTVGSGWRHSPTTCDRRVFLMTNLLDSRRCFSRLRRFAVKAMSRGPRWHWTRSPRPSMTWSNSCGPTGWAMSD